MALYYIRCEEESHNRLVRVDAVEQETRGGARIPTTCPACHPIQIQLIDGSEEEELS